jgi:hypothetical protein
VAVRNAPGTASTRPAAWMRRVKRKGACDARVAVGGGERGREREESAARRSAPFEMVAGEAREGVRGWAPCGGQERERMRGPEHGGG